jgi:hypothetical protein
VQHLSEPLVPVEANVDQGLVETSDRATVHLLVRPITAVEAHNRGVATTGLRIPGRTTERFRPAANVARRVCPAATVERSETESGEHERQPGTTPSRSPDGVSHSASPPAAALRMIQSNYPSAWQPASRPTTRAGQLYRTAPPAWSTNPVDTSIAIGQASLTINAAVWQSYADASVEHRDIHDPDVVVVLHAAQVEVEMLTLAARGRLN